MIEFTRTELLEIKDEILGVLESCYMGDSGEVDLSLEPPVHFDDSLSTGRILRLQSILNKLKDVEEV